MASERIEKLKRQPESIPPELRGQGEPKPRRQLVPSSHGTGYEVVTVKSDTPQRRPDATRITPTYGPLDLLRDIANYNDEPNGEVTVKAADLRAVFAELDRLAPKEQSNGE